MKSPRSALLLNPTKLLRDFPPSSRYLIGVSGGRDSVALLRSLVDLGYKRLVICHLNHQLRGRSSTADAKFVEKLADKYDVDLVLGSTNVRALAKKKKMSIETAARNARYSFFAKVAKQKKCRTIFLGHHADDLVETFLLNLFRGAGTTGLSGMREVAKRRIDDVDLTIIRPLLGIWRSDIDKYIRRHRLNFREDASNRDLAPLRNRLRRQIIPSLEKSLGRSIRRNIWRTATITAEEDDFFETLLPEKLSEISALAVKPLREMPATVQRRMLRHWLNGAKVADIGFDLIERVRALLDVANRAAKTNLPQDRHVRRRAGKLFVE